MLPRELLGREEVMPERMAVATMAPTHWAMMYRTARRTLIWQLSSSPRVTAGLRWAPLMWPTLWAIVAMLSPKARDTFTLSWAAPEVWLFFSGKLKPRAEPMLMTMKRIMARNSATTALQKSFFLNSLAMLAGAWLETAAGA